MEGALVSDSLWLGADAHAIAFGCQAAETGEIFNQQADGIVGLSAAALSLPSQLAAQGAVAPEFTICYGAEGGASRCAIACAEGAPATRSRVASCSDQSWQRTDFWVRV